MSFLRGAALMATYRYIARGPDGREVRGLMEGDSEAVVVRTLDENDLFPVSVSPEQGERAAGPAGGKRVRLSEVGVVYGQLGDLLEGGVPLLRSLETLIRATRPGALKQALRHVRDEVADGRALADAMAAHPNAFSSLHTAMIRAAEQGGFLEETLVNLSGFVERVDELRARVRGALIYPAVLTIAGVLALLGILLLIVPTFKQFFVDVPLPLPTRALFAMSDLLLYHWPILIVGGIAAGVAVGAAIRSPSGREAWQRLQLRLPVVGGLLRALAVSRFCRILGTLLRNGVGLLPALKISRDATGSDVLKVHIDEAAESVRGGEKLAEKLAESGFFAVDVIEMLAVAEESNQMEKVLLQVAEKVDRRAARQLDTMVRLMEPLILVVLTAAIGFMAVGIMYPILTMAQTLNG